MNNNYVITCWILGDGTERIMIRCECICYYFLHRQSLFHTICRYHSLQRRKLERSKRMKVPQSVSKCGGDNVTMLRKKPNGNIQRINTITPHVSIQLPFPSCIHSINNGLPVVGSIIHRCVYVFATWYCTQLCTR